MKLFEYMGKELFDKYNIPVPKGGVAGTPEEAAKQAENLEEAVVKSQILSGKRGKAGGIKFVSGKEHARQAADELLGMELKGLKVEKVLVEEKLPIEKEFYLAITLDGTLKKPIILASVEGGMDIEDVPEEKMVRHPINTNLGVQPYLGKDIADRLGFSGNQAKQFAKILANLYQAFKELDAELMEINPLVLAADKLIAADAKVTIDDDALYRHKDLPKVEERTDAEKKAYALGLSYVELDGNIAIMANGAGITMATLDIIQHYGGAPANFLDAGGGAGVEATAKALEILLSTNPKAILINIFGGITRCDDVATAFITVKKQRKIPVPVVIRLVGTNEDKGVQILKDNGIEAFGTMDEAAKAAVQLATQ
ncbi:ADP-forming succinate--CoA ligase subunit beta [Metallumcola ferriviriculae]|uniref:Succinate--CoA ligase [ADP-forming] subunit beta n=1 Tax=Metallumcola ferriviriculae TaxID=3039180 RepID=A0AAU0UQJ1_9FIRM|nr:ADP-forming succinate--CoA ligase subunit beta [Desulfitibacteraceae bacterium MK1]